MHIHASHTLPRVGWRAHARQIVFDVWTASVHVHVVIYHTRTELEASSVDVELLVSCTLDIDKWVEHCEPLQHRYFRAAIGAGPRANTPAAFLSSPFGRFKADGPQQTAAKVFE